MVGVPFTWPILVASFWSFALFHTQYDWTSGVPDNGNGNGGSSAPHLACTPCVPLFCTSFNGGENRGAFRLPGAGGGGSFPLCGGTFARSYSVSTCAFADVDHLTVVSSIITLEHLFVLNSLGVG